MDLHLTTAPHVHANQSTRTLMLHVLIALMPCCVFGVWHFGGSALALMLTATASAVLAEFLFQKARGQKALVGDLSAAVTGLLLALKMFPGRGSIWWLNLITVFAFAERWNSPLPSWMLSCMPRKTISICETVRSIP